MQTRPIGKLPGERRRWLRQKVLLAGKIVLSGGVTYDCGISDLSSEGAGLRVGRFLTLPDEFRLVVLSTGMAHLCVARWRTAPWTGVKFAQTWDLREALGQPQLRRLWLAATAPELPPAINRETQDRVRAASNYANRARPIAR